MSRLISWCSSRIRTVPFGMRGLANFNLSCCVNTLLQTFSATGELAELLDTWEAADVTAEGCNVPLQLKRVIAAMRSDHHQPVSHQEFLYCLDRNNVTLNTQHDADEVFLFILNHIQQQMDDQTLAHQILSLYKISVESHLQCLECSSVQTETSYLLNMPLHIKDRHSSLEECLKSFFEHYELKGINSCFCEQCGMKTPSKQGVKLLFLPPVLCMHLKRFRNRSGFTHKLNCKVTFPETLDLSEWIKEAFSTNFVQNGTTYTLYAVAVHSGSAFVGHYTAFVRHKGTQRWYYADDSHVVEVSWKDVQAAYGGQSWGQTAYMLMYRRENQLEAGQQTSSS